MRISKVQHLHTQQIQHLSEINKTTSVFGKLLTSLPSRATVQTEQKSKPAKFNENFSDLMSGTNFKKELSAQSSVVAPFIFLGKIGSTIVSKFKGALESLNGTPKDESKLEVDKLVQHAKKNTPKSKIKH